jgi:hypothetical protein
MLISFYLSTTFNLIFGILNFRYLAYGSSYNFNSIINSYLEIPIKMTKLKTDYDISIDYYAGIV